MAESQPGEPLDYASPRTTRCESAGPVRFGLLIVAIVLPSVVDVAFVTAAEWPRRVEMLAASGIIWGLLASAIGGSAVLLLRARVHDAFLLLFVPAQLVWVFFFTFILSAAFGDPVKF